MVSVSTEKFICRNYNKKGLCLNATENGFPNKSHSFFYCFDPGSLYMFSSPDYPLEQGIGKGHCNSLFTNAKFRSTDSFS